MSYGAGRMSQQNISTATNQVPDNAINDLLNNETLPTSGGDYLFSEQ